MDKKKVEHYRKRLLAKQEGIELSSLTGSGPEGRIVKRDGRVVPLPESKNAELTSGVPILPGIRTDTAVRKATATQRPIVEFAPETRAARDFVDLAGAIEHRCNEERPTL